jgi:hypothetical protein
MSEVEAPIAASAEDLTREIEQAIAEKDFEGTAARYWLEVHGVRRIFWPIAMWAARRLVRKRILPEFVRSVHDVISAKAGPA